MLLSPAPVFPVAVHVRKRQRSRYEVCSLATQTDNDIQAWLVRLAWVAWNFDHFNRAVVVQREKMLLSPMSNIGVCLECSRIAVYAIIVPFLKCWRNERIRGEKDNHDHQADTDVEHGVFHLSG